MAVLQDRVGAIIAQAPGRWGVTVRAVEGATTPPVEIHADRMLRSASAAKILLLATVSRQIYDGTLDADAILSREDVAPVADSGLWQHLRRSGLPVADIAALVGAVSDNWATNVLIDAVGGVGAVAETARLFGTPEVALHDVVRDERGPDDPPTLSTGSARGYGDLLAALWTRRAEPVAGRVLDWLRLGVDHSMVAAAFGLDPLAHQVADRGWTVIQKTGTDTGVRVDVGLVSTERSTVAYACLANWDEHDGSSRDDVLDAMRAVGMAVRDEMSY